jgi:hypothetical protein
MTKKKKLTKMMITGYISFVVPIQRLNRPHHRTLKIVRLWTIVTNEFRLHDNERYIRVPVNTVYVLTIHQITVK